MFSLKVLGIVEGFSAHPLPDGHTGQSPGDFDLFFHCFVSF